MTNEEAIEQFKYAIDLIKQDGKDYLDERDIPMLKMGIEALENQKSVIEELEKIKEEISGRCIFSISKIDVLDIIDNHISELKGENNAEFKMQIKET